MTIGQGITIVLLVSLVLGCFLTHLFPEHPRKVKRVKVYYHRDNIGRFTAASRKNKKIEWVGGPHKYVTNL